MGCVAAECLHVANVEVGSYREYLRAVAMIWRTSFTPNPDSSFPVWTVAFSSGLGLFVKQRVNDVSELRLVSHGKANPLWPQIKCFHSCPCLEMGVNCCERGKLWRC